MGREQLKIRDAARLTCQMFTPARERSKGDELCRRLSGWRPGRKGNYCKDLLHLHGRRLSQRQRKRISLELRIPQGPLTVCYCALLWHRQRLRLGKREQRCLWLHLKVLKSSGYLLVGSARASSRLLVYPCRASTFLMQHQSDSYFKFDVLLAQSSPSSSSESSSRAALR